MASSVFITGASGFIGSRLLRKMDVQRYEHIYGLCRSDERSTVRFQELDRVRFIPADIHDAEAYAPYLSSSDVVLHLAARTGKAEPQEYFQVNTQGTKVLVEQCERSGVKHFLHVSSIAVKFPDQSRYYYAQSKRQAEQIVRDSALRYTIVRPTLVLGKEAVIWRRLSQLAHAPVLFLPGDGAARIQPIYVDDLVAILLSVIDERAFSHETFELGGPEVVPIGDFLRRIHHAYYRKDPLVVHVPLRLVMPVLSFLERRCSSLLPFSAGQLSAFIYDGIAESNSLLQWHKLRMKNIQTMLALLIGNE